MPWAVARLANPSCTLCKVNSNAVNRTLALSLFVPWHFENGKCTKTGTEKTTQRTQRKWLEVLRGEQCRSPRSASWQLFVRLQWASIDWWKLQFCAFIAVWHSLVNFQNYSKLCCSHAAQLKNGTAEKWIWSTSLLKDSTTCWLRLGKNYAVFSNHTIELTQPLRLECSPL